MRQLRWLFALSAVTVLSACGPQAPPTSPPVVDGSSLLASLERAGVQLREADVDIAPIEGVVSRAYAVNGEIVIIHEFPSAQARDRYAQDIIDFPDGAKELISSETKVWGASKLLVMYEGTNGGTILLLSGLLGDPIVAIEAAIDEPYPPAVVAAIYLVADDLSVDPAMVEVSSMTPVIWPDSCLMVPEPDEGCLAVETPGWRVMLKIYGETIEAHTDEFGEVVRWR